MNNFRGYLLKENVTNTIFPNKYIEIDTFKSTPNMREEIKAVRDDYTRDLTRITANGTKSQFSFTTIPIDLNQLIDILDFFTKAESNHLQRKISLTYWNDEELNYKSGIFYRPDIEYTKSEITSDNIYYEPITLEFVEY